ncbi:MAG: sulfotransferase family protein [Gammaproteobacteria bacterium]
MSEAATASNLAGFHLDYPSPGWIGNKYTLPIQGWIIANQEEPIVVEALCDAVVLRKSKVHRSRPDVLKRHPDHPHAAVSGFAMMIGLLGLPPQFRIALRAVMPDGRRVPLAVLEGQHVHLGTDYEYVLRPLLVTMQGRVGSSWFMRLLSEHPAIVVQPPHFGDPYEGRIASYWLHMLKVLSEPADHEDSTSRVNFTFDRKWIGHHPFYTSSMVRRPEMEQWFGRLYPERLAAFSAQTIDEFYLRVAKLAHKTQPLFFAEKCHAEHVPWIAWGIYPDAKEIFLVRDFRDMITSILAFNKKRGYQAFGREQVDSDLAYVDKMRANVEKLRKTWELRADRAYLVKYEDLVKNTKDTLERVMDYLGIDTDVPKLIEHATASPAMDGHRTVKDSSASIGRWKQDLSPDLREACNTGFQDALRAFEYE